MPTQIRYYLYLGSLIVLVPLIRIQIFFDPFTMGRFVFWSLVNLFGLWLLYPHFKKLKFHLLDLIILLFLVVNFISVSWALNFGEAIFLSQKYFLFLWTYFTVKQILLNDPNQKENVYQFALFIGIISCCFLGYEVYSVSRQIGLDGDNIYLISGLSGHKNPDSSHLFILLGLIIALHISKKQSIRVIGSVVLFLLMIFLLRSRSVYLAVIALVFTAVIFLLKRNLDRRLIIYGVIVVTVLGFPGALFLTKTDLGNQYLQYLDPSEYLKSTTGQERRFVWYKTGEIIKERPIFGHGCGNWKFWLPSKNIQGGFRMQDQGLIFTRAHNDYLEVWVEVGIVGLLIYLAIFIVAIMSCVHELSKLNRVDQLRRIILLGTIIGYMIISFFSFPKDRLEHQILLAVMLGWIAILNPDYLKLNIQLGTVSKRILWIISLGLLLISLPIGYYRSKSEVASKQILLATAAQNTPVIHGLVDDATSIWQNVNLMVVPYIWYEGIAYFWEEKYEQAEIAFAEAYHINPFNFNVLNNYGSTLVKLEKYQDAIEIYHKALEINPKFEEALFNISFAYYQTGDVQSAIYWVNRIEKDLERKKIFLETIESSDE